MWMPFSIEPLKVAPASICPCTTCSGAIANADVPILLASSGLSPPTKETWARRHKAAIGRDFRQGCNPAVLGAIPHAGSRSLD